MPPLISFEEALALGELTGREEIGGLVERAWAVRREKFGDSTDMCSLVNAKSGGCAEDRGQSDPGANAHRLIVGQGRDGVEPGPASSAGHGGE